MNSKQPRLMSKKIYILIPLLFVFGILIYVFALPTRGLVKVEDYIHYGGSGDVCQAQSPECGYCPGEVHNKQCYVDPNDNMQNYILK